MWDDRAAEIRVLRPRIIRLFIQEYFNLLPERQAQEVEKVKKYESGMAIAWLRQIGFDTGSLVKYKKGDPLPRPGCLMRYNTAGNKIMTTLNGACQLQMCRELQTMVAEVVEAMRLLLNMETYCLHWVDLWSNIGTLTSWE
jgi:hypothetical protein